MKKYNEDSYTGDFFFKVDVHYPEKWHKFHSDFPFFLCERMIVEKVEKLIGKLYEKNILYTYKL